MAKSKEQLKRKIKPYMYLLPILAVSVLFCFMPAAKSLLFSFCRVNGKGQIIGFTGFNNYQYLLTSKNFISAFRNTMLLTVGFVCMNLILTTGLALLANKKRKFSPLYETMFTLPMAVSMPTYCMIFKVLLNPTVGAVNMLLGTNWGWFEDSHMALIGILIICIWMGFSFDFLLLLTALRAVPKETVEAAKMDGAGRIQRFFHIILPRLSPTILYVVSTNTILAMMTSGPVLILTQGGPNRATTTLIQMMYTAGYGSSNYSLASCISVITFILTFGLTIAAFAVERKVVSYE